MVSVIGGGIQTFVSPNSEAPGWYLSGYFEDPKLEGLSRNSDIKSDDGGGGGGECVVW